MLMVNIDTVCKKVEMHWVVGISLTKCDVIPIRPIEDRQYIILVIKNVILARHDWVIIRLSGGGWDIDKSTFMLIRRVIIEEKIFKAEIVATNRSLVSSKSVVFYGNIRLLRGLGHI